MAAQIVVTFTVPLSGPNLGDPVDKAAKKSAKSGTARLSSLLWLR